MSRHLFTIGGYAVLVLITLAPARGDDVPPPADIGFHNVAIKTGDQTTYVKVKNQVDPFHAVKDQDGSSPDHFSFGKTSPMAHQSYDLANTASSHDDGSYQKSMEHTFITKSYFENVADAGARSAPDLHKLVAVNSAEGYAITAAGYDKSFATTTANVDQNKTAEGSDSTSDFQGRSAVVGGHEVKKFASDMSTKTFQGREADAVKNDLSRTNEGLLAMKNLPNRALTIDEVRALINHGVKPDTDEKPAEPSKPLDDPLYTPDAAPAPPRAQPADDHLIDQNDIVPPPGMVAHPQGVAPEDSEPLPH